MEPVGSRALFLLPLLAGCVTTSSQVASSNLQSTAEGVGTVVAAGAFLAGKGVGKLVESANRGNERLLLSEAGSGGRPKLNRHIIDIEEAFKKKNQRPEPTDLRKRWRRARAKYR